MGEADRDATNHSLVPTEETQSPGDAENKIVEMEIQENERDGPSKKIKVLQSLVLYMGVIDLVSVKFMFVIICWLNHLDY